MNSPSILLLDKTGLPIEWASWQSVTSLYAKEAVIWTLGDIAYKVRGGFNRATQQQSSIGLHSIVAIEGVLRARSNRAVPLTNRALFRRDGNLCMYCGKPFSDADLTRDHIVPSSRGGTDTWNNVAAACKRCNNYKGNKLLSETQLELKALPYTPNFSEFLAIVNSRKILADQMAFLQASFSANFRPV